MFLIGAFDTPSLLYNNTRIGVPLAQHEKLCVILRLKCSRPYINKVVIRNLRELLTFSPSSPSSSKKVTLVIVPIAMPAHAAYRLWYVAGEPMTPFY
jgi:hypothetical protein